MNCLKTNHTNMNLQMNFIFMHFIELKMTDHLVVETCSRVTCLIKHNE